MSDSAASMIEGLISLYPGVLTLPRLTLACLVWHTYDWCLNFDREWAYIWQRKKTMGSVLYVVLRIWATAVPGFDFAVLMARHDNAQFCSAFGWAGSITTGVLILLIQILLQGRVFALYQGDKRILYFNSCFFLLTAAATGATWYKELPEIGAIAAPEPLVGCWLMIPRLMIGGLLPAVAFDTWLFLLVAWKVVQDFRWRRKHPSAAGGKTVSSVVIRDYLLWFASALLGVMGSIFVFLWGPAVYNFSGIPLFVGLMAVGGCRMVLNVREAYFLVQMSESRPSMTTQVFTGIGEFAKRPATTQTIATVDFAQVDRTTFVTQPGELETGGLAIDEDDASVSSQADFWRLHLSEDERAYIKDM